MVRARPSSGVLSTDRAAAVATGASLDRFSCFDRPHQFSGTQTTMLISAKISRVCRQPTDSASWWPITQKTVEAKAPYRVR
jgi:hypothetical protein